MRQKITALLFLLNFGLFLSFFDVWTHEQILDVRKFTRELDFAYQYHLNFLEILFAASDSSSFPTASKLLLYENDKQLGPSHSIHNLIRQVGSGRYSHWKHRVYFSTSDNSDPIKNGQIYKIKYPINCPFSVFLVTSIVLVASMLGIRKTMQRVLFPGMFVCLGLATVIVPLEIFLRTDYSKFHVLGPFGTLPARLQPTLNTKGYRDVEHRIEKPREKVRILILGDSMTFGAGISDEEIYPRLLANLAGPRVEVITLAKNGWSTADQLIALRREGLAYGPDIVVIGVVTNDLQPVVTEPSGQRQEWAIFTRLSMGLDSFRFLDNSLNRIGDRMDLTYSYAKWEEDLYDPKKRYWVPWKRTVHELSEVLQSCTIPGYAFILISPVGPSTDTQVKKYEKLSQVFSEEGFRATNLWRVYMQKFGGIEEKQLWALPNDPHPGLEINKFFAKEIWKVIQQDVQRLLDIALPSGTTGSESLH